MFLDTYAPLKRVTLGLQKSASVKNIINIITITNFIDNKDAIVKEECHTNYKQI